MTFSSFMHPYFYPNHKSYFHFKAKQYRRYYPTSNHRTLHCFHWHELLFSLDSCTRSMALSSIHTLLPLYFSSLIFTKEAITIRSKKAEIDEGKMIYTKNHPYLVHSNLPCLPGKLPAIHQAQCKQFPKNKRNVSLYFTL